jgi:hypothetical protein
MYAITKKSIFMKHETYISKLQTSRNMKLSNHTAMFDHVYTRYIYISKLQTSTNVKLKKP